MIYVFTGPTIPAAEVTLRLECTCLPPAAQGDIYRAALYRPQAIVIIDGYFSRVPAIWHKEILWAMSQGIHVFGASSMGALRAAELHPFGMIGAGRIFAAFKANELEDDDEVAVLHAPAEMGFEPLSEAMVNIRATLAKARAAGIIGEGLEALLADRAKGLYYGLRSYERILSEPAGDVALDREMIRLGDWLPAGRIDQKREDAIELLELVASLRDELRQPKRVTFEFEFTELWREFVTAAGAFSRSAPEGRRDEAAKVLPEEIEACLAREPEHLRAALRETLLRMLTFDAALAQGFELSDSELEAMIVDFCAERGLKNPHDVLGWMEANDLGQREFLRLIYEEALIRRFESRAAPEVKYNLPDHLRVAGIYPAIRARLLGRGNS